MISIKNLTKKYPNGLEANKNISLDIDIGEVLGIVGVNGSGKTTLIRQILKLLKPTSGEILVDGTRDYLPLIAYAPQSPVYYPSLTVRETIELALKLRGVAKNEIKSRAQEALEFMNLTKHDKYYGYMLSGGLLKKLMFAIVFSMDTPYIILDEPTAMVDIVSKEEIWEAVLNCNNKRKKGFIIATHDMNEVKKLCTSIAVIKSGEVIFNGKINELNKDYYKAEVYTQDTKIKIYFEEKNINFEEKQGGYKVTTTELTDMFDILKGINETFKIDNLSFEYPSIYNEVITLVKND